MVAFHQHNPRRFQMYQGVEDLFQPGAATAAASGTNSPAAAHHPQTLLYNLAVVKEKVQQVNSLVNLVAAQSAPDSIQHESLAIMASGARDLIQDLIVAASSMMCTFQQLAASATEGDDVNEDDVLVLPHHLRHEDAHHMKAGGGFMATEQAPDAHEAFDAVLHDDALYNYGSGEGGDNAGTPPEGTTAACEIIEIDAADLLAMYTHYCQVCGKGFKRDANLRMHMRAHGDEYKTNAALSNPAKGGGGGATTAVWLEAAAGGTGSKYSCPQDGCRWNKNHAKFQPLKSMICVKNHYKRSHCPKMFVCNRCNCKQFAVLSDLRTHEKHCGDLRWLCSCGTTFSRKDKLMGHVALFVGHTPVVNCFTK